MTSGFRLLTAFPQIQVVNFSTIGKVNFYMFIYKPGRILDSVCNQYRGSLAGCR